MLFVSTWLLQAAFCRPHWVSYQKTESWKLLFLCLFARRIKSLPICLSKHYYSYMGLYFYSGTYSVTYSSLSWSISCFIYFHFYLMIMYGMYIQVVFWIWTLFHILLCCVASHAHTFEMWPLIILYLHRKFDISNSVHSVL